MTKTVCNVRFYRTYYGMTEKELAKATGTACSTISEIETGKRLPNVMLGIKIARALNTNIELLWEEVTE